ncbi:MAG: radical SAM protein [Deltaproteobacteria bacterium]|nr:radical SAM protein [Deltaproteobacteria bacterium]
MSIAFGPIPSRRLGQSLGVNHVIGKACTYCCPYCQVGPTRRRRVARQRFYAPEQVAADVSARLRELRRRGQDVDHLSLVPEGEPALDRHLGEIIEWLRPTGVPIAVITNASLLWRDELRAELAKADWVSLKVDGVSEPVWRRMNVPHRDLRLEQVLDGVRRFAAEFEGELVTETMLLGGVNDAPDEIVATAAFVAALEPRRAYLALPVRPPAVPSSRAPSELALARAYRIFAEQIAVVECLTGYPEAGCGPCGDAEKDLLAIAAVHPLRREEVAQLLAQAGADFGLVDELVRSGQLRQVEHAGRRFYLRPASGGRGG